jgi:H+-transporting ATPase
MADLTRTPTVNTPQGSGTSDEKPVKESERLPTDKTSEDDAERGENAHKEDAHRSEVDLQQEEDLDHLIDELASDDGNEPLESAEDAPAGEVTVPEELLKTNTQMGLTNEEVLARRKKYGLNQMKEEKENMFLKFCSYFVGPIQFVMEV